MYVKVFNMAETLKKLVSFDNVASYDQLIKRYIADADAVVNAKSIKTVLIDGDNIKFYKKENATTSDTADYTVAISSSDVETLKTQMAAVQAQAKTNKESIEAINDAQTGILATSKAYTDEEIQKVNDTIGTVADGQTVVSMIADAKKAGTDANTALEAYKTANDAEVATVKAAAKAAQDDVDALETTVGDMTNVKTTAKTVAGAVDELKDAIDFATTAGEITIVDASVPTEGYLKTYIVSQGGEEVGKIDIPKDMVVKSGEVVVDPEGQPAGTYIKIVIANDEETPIYINVANLVDIYKGAETATQVKIAVDGYTISASIVAGGVGTTELADSAVTTVKIADENVTKAKLSADVQATLAKADAAEQAITDAIAELDSEQSQVASADNGQLALSITEVDGKITAISGSIAENTYDAYGEASKVQSDLDNYKYTIATTAEINSLFADASEAE